MRTRDRRVNRYGPVDLPGYIGLSEDLRQYAIPGAVAGIAAMPLPHRLPRTELLAGQMISKVVLSAVLVPPLIYLAVSIGRRLDA